jgi:very-short-patch-repair endonuclease
VIGMSQSDPNFDNPSHCVTAPYQGAILHYSPLSRETDEGYLLPANLKLKPRSHTMSRNMTKSEQIIWFNCLKSSKTGYKFTKQKIIHHYIVDFYCSKFRLAVEIDGDTHAQTAEYDKQRTDFLNTLGITVIRFTNDEVKQNIEGVFTVLVSKIKELEMEIYKVV